MIELRLNKRQTEEAVQEYVYAAMRAAVDDRTPEEHEEYARRMIAVGWAHVIYRATASLLLA